MKDPSAITVELHEDESKERAVARTAISPSLQSALALRQYSNAAGELDLMSLVGELRLQIDKTIDGDMERARDLTPNDAQAWLDLATLYERVQVLEKSWEARAKAANLVGTEAITRDEQGRFVVVGGAL